eukprot:scaffold1409_cov290-Prasinococcus_capsulatus_cf.AAC.1
MGKRQTMNLLLLGAVGVPAASLAGGFLYFLVPPSSGGAGGGVVAKDKVGNDVKESAWLAEHLEGDYSLVEGLKGDATYLVVRDGGLAPFGIVAVCTHLGCVVRTLRPAAPAPAHAPRRSLPLTCAPRRRRCHGTPRRTSSRARATARSTTRTAA